MIRLDLVVGPNGAGKSTFIRFVLQPELPQSVFVNADEIATLHWPDAAESHAYEAAEIAARTRAALIAARRPFIAETVFSHPSKLDLVRAAQSVGYTVFLHVVLVPVELSVARVRYRVAAGGHSVPEDKIRGRHARLFANVAEAIALADEAFVYDNSELAGPRLLASFAAGEAVGPVSYPDWVPAGFSSR
ncbi:AAA family ATPase [Skermania sp. ID1734]|uniref:zeta toxin family protein n=1 Tax=Skermania sp. ID1734 TaxID=2597516 RepID=UPI00117F7CED|nr:zeta toxin family protein [Skermania sp. ID1734]TSE01141.1 AAA family ATPase [Skermania sp. ID1734]